MLRENWSINRPGFLLHLRPPLRYLLRSRTRHCVITTLGHPHILHSVRCMPHAPGLLYKNPRHCANSRRGQSHAKTCSPGGGDRIDSGNLLRTPSIRDGPKTSPARSLPCRWAEIIEPRRVVNTSSLVTSPYPPSCPRSLGPHPHVATRTSFLSNRFPPSSKHSALNGRTLTVLGCIGGIAWIECT